MDKKLLCDFESELKTKPQITKLDDSELDIIQKNINTEFKIDLNRTWCWESLGDDHQVMNYGEEDGLEKIKGLLKKNLDIKIVVTDEDVPPWFGFKGSLVELLDVIRELRYFEFFIIDETFTWIIFDTHHNSLVYAGLKS